MMYLQRRRIHVGWVERSETQQYAEDAPRIGFCQYYVLGVGYRFARPNLQLLNE